MGFIGSLLVGLIGLFVVAAIAYALCRWQPWLRFVIPLAVGISVGVSSAWWGGVIVFLILFGLLIRLTETKVHRGDATYTLRCHKCGNDFIDIINETKQTVEYKCDKCGYHCVTHLTGQ